MAIGIYKIINPKNKIYIGQSIDLDGRLKVYEIGRCKKQIRLYNSIKKYGWNNHIFQIIEECKVEELNGRERYYQDLYNVLGKNGLNCKLTETNDRVGIISEEAKKKIREKRKYQIFSEETKKKLSDTLTGKLKTSEHRENIRKSKLGNTYGSANKGRVFSEETRRKMSEAKIGNTSAKGLKRTEEQKKRIIESLKGNKNGAGNKGRVSPFKGMSITEYKDKKFIHNKMC